MKVKAVLMLLVLASRAAVADEALSADQLLKKSLDFLGAQNSVRVKAKQVMSVEGEGMLTRWETDYDIALERPARAAFRITRGIMGGTLVCDGTNLSLYMPAMKGYSVEPAPESLDRLAEQVAEEGPMGAAFALLELFLSAKPYQAFTKELKDLELKGVEKLDGTETYHVAGSSKTMGRVDVWLDKGPRPLLRRVVYDLSELMRGEQIPIPDARMELVVELRDWSLAGEIDPSVFFFQPPAGARALGEIVGAAATPHPLVGRDAPLFELTSLEGQKVKLSDYLGTNVVVLDFWASWCGPCRRGLPVVSRVAQESADKGVVFFAVNQGEDAEKAKTFMKENHLQFTVLLDSDESVGKKYGVRGIPQTVVIGRDGRISAVHVGFGRNAEKQLRQDIEKALSGGAAETE